LVSSRRAATKERVRKCHSVELIEMRVMILGKSGQVARELASVSWSGVGSVAQFGRAECDLADANAIMRAADAVRPDVIVNAAAYTAVDRAESEPDVARAVNCDGPAALAKACQKSGTILIHLSTDYVFDGSKPGAYREDDPVTPLSVYGRTKADGENAIRETVPAHVIVRTSWVFASHGRNFVHTMLRLAAERPEIRIIDDQRGAPTAARDIAGAIASIIQSIARGKHAWGTFHYTSSEPTTWYGFARAILDQAGRQARLFPISTAEYETPARRPLNSVLDCTRIARAYGIDQPNWRTSLDTVLAELGANSAAGVGSIT
jgi:dTDP-4-dehydrorhamnose reductase